MASTIDLNQSAFKHYQNGLSNSNIYACIGKKSFPKINPEMALRISSNGLETTWLTKYFYN